VPASLDNITVDADLSGVTLTRFAERVVRDQLATAWGAIVVMHNGNPANPGTLANPSGRPYLVYYPAESILDWAFSVALTPTGPQRVLSMLRLHEFVSVPSTDEFAPGSTEQVRVLDIERGIGYRERIYRPATEKDGKKNWVLIQTSRPLAGGIPLPTVPAVLVDPSDTGLPTTAPLASIAALNTSHWRTTADLEHAAHFCGLPTPYITGVSAGSVPAGDIRRAIDEYAAGPVTGGESIRRDRVGSTAGSLVLGSSQGIVLENPNAKVGYLEFTGAGLQPLQSMLAHKEAQMAVLGARLIAPDKKAAESGEALAIRRSSETAPLIGVAHTVSAAVTRALRIVARWQLVADTEPVTFQLNTEYTAQMLGGQDLTAMLSAWQAGAMSIETFVHNLKRGGRLADGVSEADEIERINAAGAALGTVTE
jgi:hypothetical protein